MNKLDTLHDLNQRLDAAEGRLALLDQYYAGEQPLSFLAPEARAALGSRFARMSSNLCRLTVSSLAERLRVTGIVRDGQSDRQAWAGWLRNDLDQLAAAAHREALTLGRSYVIVWADPAGRARVTVESARQVTVRRDPATREVTDAVKRWVDPAARRAYAVLYQPDQITRYTSTAMVAEGAAIPAQAWESTEVIPNPLGVVPVVPLVNTDRLLDLDGRSELADLLPLVDGLNKSLADLMVASEYYARPRRWATGVELVEEPVLNLDGTPQLDDDGQPVTSLVNPYPEGNRMMINEAPEGKFGQLPGADLAAYEAGVRIILGQIMAVSALPAHYVGIFSDNPTSADALRAAEASLAARAEARQQTFGRSWEAVARLMLAVETGADPTALDVRITWADPATRSIAQEADAVVKLHAAGILPTAVALARLGYTDDEIEQIRSARRAQALDTVLVDPKALAS